MVPNWRGTQAQKIQNRSSQDRPVVRASLQELKTKSNAEARNPSITAPPLAPRRTDRRANHRFLFAVAASGSRTSDGARRVGGSRGTGLGIYLLLGAAQHRNPGEAAPGQQPVRAAEQ